MWIYIATQQEVIIPPRIIIPPQSIYKKIYTQANLSCLAVGYPTPEIQWFKDQNLLKDKRLPYLFIPELEVEDRGNYYCKVVSVYDTQGSNNSIQSKDVIVNIQGISNR